jgi:hypothetical protein
MACHPEGRDIRGAYGLYDVLFGGDHAMPPLSRTPAHTDPEGRSRLTRLRVGHRSSTPSVQGWPLRVAVPSAKVIVS